MKQKRPLGHLLPRGFARPLITWIHSLPDSWKWVSGEPSDLVVNTHHEFISGYWQTNRRRPFAIRWGLDNIETFDEFYSFRPKNSTKRGETFEKIFILWLLKKDTMCSIKTSKIWSGQQAIAFLASPLTTPSNPEKKWSLFYRAVNSGSLLCRRRMPHN